MIQIQEIAVCSMCTRAELRVRYQAVAAFVTLDGGNEREDMPQIVYVCNEHLLSVFQNIKVMV